MKQNNALNEIKQATYHPQNSKKAIFVRQSLYEAFIKGTPSNNGIPILNNSLSIINRLLMIQLQQRLL